MCENSETKTTTEEDVLLDMIKSAQWDVNYHEEKLHEAKIRLNLLINSKQSNQSKKA